MHLCQDELAAAGLLLHFTQGLELWFHALLTRLRFQLTPVPPALSKGVEQTLLRGAGPLQAPLLVVEASQPRPRQRRRCIRIVKGRVVTT